MRRDLREALTQYAQAVDAMRSGAMTLGGDDEDPRARLARQLAQAEQWHRQRKFLPVAAMALAVVAAILLALLWSHEPTIVSGLFGAVGLLVTGLIRWLTGILKDAWRVQVAIAALPVLDNDTLAKVILILLR